VIRLLFSLLGLGYVICPYDLVPDFFVGAGWIDDIIVAGLIWWFFYKKRQPEPGTGQDSTRARTGAGPGKREGDAAGETSGTKTPYSILGISEGASPDEIRRAYLELAARYHPDKVSHLGMEFRELAEQRFKEIQAAYATLRK